jgi:hypothetical protein
LKSQWPQLAHHRWKKLGRRRVDVHSPLQHRVRSLGVHEVEDAVNRLISLDAENGRSQDVLIGSVDQYLS